MLCHAIVAPSCSVTLLPYKNEKGSSVICFDEQLGLTYVTNTLFPVDSAVGLFALPVTLYWKIILDFVHASFPVNPSCV